MSIYADVGTGTTMAFSSAAFSAGITSLSWDGATREAIDVSYLGTSTSATGGFGTKEFIASKLVDGGELSIEGLFDPAQIPPIHAAAQTVTVTFANSKVWSFSGFMRKFSVQIPLEDKMTFSGTVKVNGKITVT